MIQKLPIFIIVFLFIVPTGAMSQSFSVYPEKISQGEVVLVKIAPHWFVPGTIVNVFGRTLEPNKNDEVYIGVDPETSPGKYKIYLTNKHIHGRTDWFNGEIEVLDKKFPESRIQRRIVRSKNLMRVKEAQAIGQAYRRGNPGEDYMVEKFSDSLDQVKITDDFYRKRIYLNGISTHRGVDLRAAIGTSVKAINRGKVVMTAHNFSLEGNMVIIDHGSGVFSLYLHLSEIKVKEGEIVDSGYEIGLSGDTGAGVTGPHLHLAVRIHGTSVDPLAFIEILQNR